MLLDTSSIVYGFGNRKDVFEAALAVFPHCRLCISKGIIMELNKLSKNRGSKGAAARLSLQAVKRYGLEVDSNAGSGDSWIVRMAGEGERPKVITNDTALAKRLESLNVKAFKLTRNGMFR